MRFWPGLRPGPRWGSSRCSPDYLVSWRGDRRFDRRTGAHHLSTHLSLVPPAALGLDTGLE